MTDTISSTESGASRVPDGKSGNLQAYQLFDYWTFSIYEAGSYIGTGEVKKPVGYCYNATLN
ncbi:hypothetical protein [Kitasatospora sp. NPDC017646]|uniref:hypothetical protein n=1 Tax=Kitasatospora sp. NPDC017646 TaxID=3364024 RepID=UPI0037A5DC5B